jgi:transcriptional regulator with XRE-family HTH domain|tara:strand:+ start:337 stop:771 length:435 start_codon:yes stop_codon:yes gene_type:complete
MSKKPTNDKRQFHNSPSKGEDMELAPKEAVRREFGKRLQGAMIDKGWNQSELARRAGVGRDNISAYIRGISMPGPVMLHKIAEALQMKPEEILPSKAMPSIDQVVPALDVRDIGKGLAWLRINQAVPWDDAIQIMNILKSDDED